MSVISEILDIITNAEFNILFKKIQEPIIHIDEKIITTLESFDWFGETEKLEFEEKYKNNIMSNYKKIIKEKEMMKQKLYNILLLMTKNKSDCFIQKVNQVIQYLFEENNLNNFTNPLVENKEYAIYNWYMEILINKYDGEDGRMECWDLEENSKTSENEISLTDVFEENTWDRELMSKVDFEELISISQLLCDIGFKVYYASIGEVSKGYICDLVNFEANRKEKIVEFKKRKYFRIYIDKDY